MRLVELEIDMAVISIEMRDDLRQPSGVFHGGVTATLIDTAMAFAVRTRLPINEATATIDLTIHYLRPHLTGTFTCTAKVVRAGKRIFTVSADVVNEDGKLIATGSQRIQEFTTDDTDRTIESSIQFSSVFICDFCGQI